jgi:hypothetical protein
MVSIFSFCCGEGEEEAKFGSVVKAVGVKDDVLMRMAV